MADIYNNQFRFIVHPRYFFMIAKPPAHNQFSICQIKFPIAVFRKKSNVLMKQSGSSRQTYLPAMKMSGN